MADATAPGLARLATLRPLTPTQRILRAFLTRRWLAADWRRYVVEIYGTPAPPTEDPPHE